MTKKFPKVVKEFPKVVKKFRKILSEFDIWTLYAMNHMAMLSLEI